MTTCQQHIYTELEGFFHYRHHDYLSLGFLGRFHIVLGRLATAHTGILHALHVHYFLHETKKKKEWEETTSSVGKRWKVKTWYRTQRLSEIKVTSLETFGTKFYLLPHFNSRLKCKEESTLSLTFNKFFSLLSLSRVACSTKVWHGFQRIEK